MSSLGQCPRGDRENLGLLRYSGEKGLGNSGAIGVSTIGYSEVAPLGNFC